MANIILYGIPNCDTTKKAMQWLKNNQIDFYFHDYKQEGISKQKLEAWCSKLGWEAVFNKHSTTWRKLTEAEQKKVINREAAIKVMQSNTSIIKRPVTEFKDLILTGFNEEIFSKQILN